MIQEIKTLIDNIVNTNNWPDRKHAFEVLRFNATFKNYTQIISFEFWLDIISACELYNEDMLIVTCDKYL